MTTIVHLNFENITYATAHELARVKIDAFRSSVVGLAVDPPAWHLDDASLPPIAEYEQLLAKARLFEKSVQSLARRIHISTRRDWRVHVFLQRDAARRPVGGAMWVLPSYQPRPRATPSLWHRLKTLFLRAWYYVRTLAARDAFDKNAIALYASAAIDNHCADSPQRRVQLQRMCASELRATTYPEPMAYYLRYLFVRTGEQGRNYGRELVDAGVAFAKEQAVPPPSLPAGAPPKATVVAVPTARAFYKKAGFELGATAVRKGKHGEHLEIAYFFMNLD